MSRPRKTTADHARDGTLRADRHSGRMREPKFDGTPTRPKQLTGEARKCWDFIVPQLVANGVAKQIDQLALEGLCIAWGEFKLAAESSIEAVVEVKGLDGSMERHTVPLGLEDLRRRQLLIAGWHRMWEGAAAKFGLTPTDRSKLEIALGDDQTNVFEQFMKKQMSGPASVN